MKIKMHLTGIPLGAAAQLMLNGAAKAIHAEPVKPDTEVPTTHVCIEVDSMTEATEILALAQSLTRHADRLTT